MYNVLFPPALVSVQTIEETNKYHRLSLCVIFRLVRLVHFTVNDEIPQLFRNNFWVT